MGTEKRSAWLLVRRLPLPGASLPFVASPLVAHPNFMLPSSPAMRSPVRGETAPLHDMSIGLSPCNPSSRT
eukprot:7303209-Prymnesium_polylepis.1